MDNNVDFTFVNDKVTYLDDNPIHLRQVSQFFNTVNCKVEVFKSCIDALVAINRSDLFICDLRLENCDDGNFNGKTILEKIRSENSRIFLALLTAFSVELTHFEKRELSRKNIYVYDKGDDELFLLQLIKDYDSYKIDNPKISSSNITEISLINNLRDKIINHLEKIPNKDITIPIPRRNDIKITDLLNEVKNETEIGIIFMNEWLETITDIQKIRKSAL